MPDGVKFRRNDVCSLLFPEALRDVRARWVSPVNVPGIGVGSVSAAAAYLSVLAHATLAFQEASVAEAGVVGRFLYFFPGLR